MTLIKCKHITMTYDSVPVVNDLSFEVREGDFLCIIGENGVGKSTLLKGILGLRKLNSGTVTFTGVRKTEIGYLPQKTQVQKDFPASVAEVVISGRQSAGRKLFYSAVDRAIAGENIELMGIGDIKNKPFNELSGGQQQRVLLARALCATQKLLFLDEPTTGLDPYATTELYKLIAHLNREHGVTVVMVTHDIGNCIHYADKVLCMEHAGNYFGTVAGYMKTPDAKRILGGEDDG